jgi:peptide alpha-N-acetyltransferase
LKILYDPKLRAHADLIAQILLELGRNQEAEDAYRQLIEQNSDNLAYYAGFLRTKGLDIGTSVDLDRLCGGVRNCDLGSNGGASIEAVL